MPRFPSLEWFEEVRQVFNSDDAFQTAGGGSCDAIVGLKIENEIYVIVFEGFECSSVRLAQEDDLYEADFYLEMTGDEWQEMILNISENGSADLGHSLNSLDLNKSPDSLAHSLNEDGYRLDFFFRYNQTFQYFFDASSRVETQF